MHEMDLIPAAYKARRARRQRQLGWAVLAGLLLLSVAGLRLWIDRGLAQERALKAQWQPLQDRADAQRAELKQLQAMIEQTRADPEAAEVPPLPIELLPSMLATLPTSGLRLSSASLEPAASAAARLHLQGQVTDEVRLGRSVSLLQAHPHVTQVQLLGVRPESSPGMNGKHFELLLHISPSAASATGSGARP